MSPTAIELTELRCSPANEMSAPSAIRRMALNTATVKEAMRARKKFVAPVIVPTWDRATANRTAAMLRGLDPAVLAVGHGRTLRDPAPAIDRALAAVGAGGR